MIKLVSKNPVLRFKDGLKILKFKNPSGELPVVRNSLPAVRNSLPAVRPSSPSVVSSVTSSVRPLLSFPDPFTASSLLKGETSMGPEIIGYVRKDDKKELKEVKNNLKKERKQTQATFLSKYNTARQHNYQKNEVTYLKTNDGKWIAKYNDKNKDLKWYYVAEGSTGYDKNGRHNILKNGKWVPVEKANERQTSERKDNSIQRKGTGSKQPLRTGSTQTTVKSSPTITYQFSGPTMLDVQGTRTDLTNDLSNADNQVNQYQLHLRGRLGTGVGWNLGYLQMFNNVNNNDDDKALLGELGLSSLPQTASELLKAMQDYAKRAGIDINGITADNFVDNKWGQQSLSAWDTLKHIITRKNKDGESMAYMTGQKQDSVVSPSVSQPYRSQYDYSRGTKGLRDLGIYDYNSMMNYVRSNPNAPFSTDLTNYLQNKYDKEYGQLTQRDIEQALDVKGRYRRGRNGDLDDINRTLSTYWSTKTPKEEPVVVNPLYSNILKNNLGEEFLNNTKKYYTTYFKKGGLISKNPVELFKAGGIMKFQGGTNSVWTNGGFMNVEIPQLPFYMDPKFTGKGIEGSNTLEGSTSLPGITVYGSQELALLDKVRRNGRDVELAKLLLDLFKNGYFDKGTSILKAVDGINGRMTRKAIDRFNQVKNAESQIDNAVKISLNSQKNLSYDVIDPSDIEEFSKYLMETSNNNVVKRLNNTFHVGANVVENMTGVPVTKLVGNLSEGAKKQAVALDLIDNHDIFINNNGTKLHVLGTDPKTGRYRWSLLGIKDTNTDESLYKKASANPGTYILGLYVINTDNNGNKTIEDIYNYNESSLKGYEDKVNSGNANLYEKTRYYIQKLGANKDIPIKETISRDEILKWYKQFKKDRKK